MRLRSLCKVTSGAGIAEIKRVCTDPGCSQSLSERQGGSSIDAVCACLCEEVLNGPHREVKGRKALAGGALGVASELHYAVSWPIAYGGNTGTASRLIAEIFSFWLA